MFGVIDLRWRRLRAVLAWCAACAVAGGGVAGSAWWHERGAAEAFGRAESRLAAARGRYTRRSPESAGNGAAPPPSSASGSRSGESAKRGPRDGPKARASPHPGSSPRTIASASRGNAEPEGPVVVRVTDMSVDFEMRHEGELPEFFRALERDAGSLFTVSGCRLVRAREIGTRGPPGQPSTRRVGFDGRPSSSPGRSRAGVRPSSPARPRPANVPKTAPSPRAAPIRTAGMMLDPIHRGSGASLPDHRERPSGDCSRPRRSARGSKRRRPVPPTSRTLPAPHKPWTALRPWSHRRRPAGSTSTECSSRSGKPITGWIDGRRVAYEQSSPERRTTAGGQPPRVRLHAGPPAPAAGDSRRNRIHAASRSRRYRRPAGSRPAPDNVLIWLPVRSSASAAVRQPPDPNEANSYERSSHLPLTEAPAPGLH